MKYELANSTWDHSEYDAMQEVIRSGKFTMGSKVEKFEKAKEMGVELANLYREYLKKESLYLEEEKNNLQSINNSSVKNIDIMIGPEGGFAEEELNQAIKSNFVPIGLGPRILRTETAPLSILSILQYKYGDFA